MEPIFKDLSPARKCWMLIFIFLISYIVFSFLAALFLLPVLNVQSLAELNELIMRGDQEVINAMKMAQIVGSIGSFIVPAHIFSLLSEGNYKAYFGFDKISSGKLFLFACMAMICANPLINAMAALNEQMQLPSFLSDLEVWMQRSEEQNKKITELFLQMNTVPELLLNILIMAFIPALAEEMFFRGAMQKTIVAMSKNIHTGIWVSAIVFSIFHFQFYGFLPRMLMGAMLGYIMVWSGSIWLPVAAHFTNNAMAVLLSYLVQKGHLPESIEQVGSLSEEIVYTLLSVVAVSYFLFLLYKNREREMVL